MEKAEAMEALRDLVGNDLRLLAERLDVKVWHPGRKMNKGWAGHVVERHLGIPLNSSQSPNLGTWELKVVPMVKTKDGKFKPKETMAITMLDEVEVVRNGFYASHLYTKLRKLILVTRQRVDDDESSSPVLGVYAFQLEESSLLQDVRTDYDTIRGILSANGMDGISGRVGKYVQARTKGTGHGSTTRAFYAKKPLIEAIIESQGLPKPTRRERSVDCREHAGVSNSSNRESLDRIMIRMPANQSGAGRHKCPYCAYEAGYADALAELGR